MARRPGPAVTARFDMTARTHVLVIALRDHTVHLYDGLVEHASLRELTRAIEAQFFPRIRRALAAPNTPVFESISPEGSHINFLSEPHAYERFFIAHSRDTTLFVTLRLFPARGWLQWLLGVIYEE